MHRCHAPGLICLALAAASTGLHAQTFKSANTSEAFPATSLTTLFASNNGFSASGAGNLFDATITNPAGLKITNFDVNVTLPNALLVLDVYVTDGSYAGKEQNSNAWVKVATGSGLTMGTDNATAVDTSDFFLAPGSYGMYLMYTSPTGVSVGPAYTNGTASNQHYSNADLTLDLGISQSMPFAGAIFDPRIWNGTVHYSSLHDKAAYGLFGAGCPGSNGTPRLEPTAGSLPKLGRRFQLTVTNLPIAVPGSLMQFGYSNQVYLGQPLPIDLGPSMGAPGCLQWCDIITTTPLVTPPTALTGEGTWGMMIPNDLALVGTFFFNQAFVVDPGWNPGHMTVSNAGVGRMGF